MLTVGQNSWATVAEANAYLGDRIGAETFFDLPDDPLAPGQESKASLMVSAFQWIMGCGQFDLSPTMADSFIKNGQIEAALFLHQHYVELNERRAAMYTGLKEFTMGRRREYLDIKQLAVPDFIAGFFSSYSSANELAELKGEYDA